MDAHESQSHQQDVETEPDISQVDQWFEGTLPQKRTANVLSIDVEDWYHGLDPDTGNWDEYEHRIVRSTRRVMRILRRGGARATFFVLGDVAENHPELVREIHEDGHEVASHGCRHQFVYNLTPKEFEADVARSIDLLYAITGEPVVSYRAPYFSITKKSLWALPILKKLGIKFDSSIFPVVNYRYGIPEAPRNPYRIEDGLIEVPIATYPMGKQNFPCGGGVYFRAFPYRFFKQLYQRMNDRGEMVVFYLHPWEVDPGQPVIEAPLGPRVRHYWALRKTAGRLAYMIRDFDFGPIREVVKL